ncbi:sensor domain-containing diguanylate cyclase [Afipia felis]|uniref:diguanylate cyclase n=2 Tax=Afipia felis TaxID=1035 RepID=A0A380W430_AFIFE|nr:sensor domain-containing diguanylate cyclase [Afipia felis]EKS30900.1 diguanylate cyclase (GGDEF) domain-containing protein [Afipia felis ATCC 53690]SUU75644.1 Bacteriophytochrome cph2 [Afipia felis]SUU83711.1 Bacteriophytochrome cph2 [Afipia felis]
MRDRTGSKLWQVSPRALTIVSVLVTLAFMMICASVLLDMRVSKEALARQSSENLAATIDADLNRNLEVYDLSLRNVVNNMVELDTQRISLPILHLILFDHAATAQYYGTIQVFDAAGNLKLDSSTLHPAQENRAGEEYFKVHRDDPEAGLYIGVPSFYRNAFGVVLSRRITGYDGSFQGVVVGSLRYSYFHDLFGKLTFASEDSVTIFRRDGVVMMRQPFDTNVIGKNIGAKAGVRRILETPSGSEKVRSDVDSIERLYVWQNSERPLVVVVGKSLASIYGTWWTQTLIIGGLILILSIFAIGATLFLNREIARRAVAEKRLSQLATTDGLTGIDNRRKFDERVLDEWRRGWQKLPLSLLMIDADHFKAFNDLYGHQAGDQLLTRIAECIAAAAKRPSDCAARYGGEEFVLLLPNTELAGALKLAEGIRKRVEDLSADKWATTVSIGVACLVPDMAGSPKDLIAAADKALYQAKEQGRNRCMAIDDEMATVAA